MIPKIDYGILSAAECRVIAQQALEQLTVEDIIRVLKSVLDGDDRTEVAAHLEEDE